MRTAYKPFTYRNTLGDFSCSAWTYPPVYIHIAYLPNLTQPNLIYRCFYLYLAMPRLAFASRYLNLSLPLRYLSLPYRAFPCITFPLPHLCIYIYIYTCYIHTCTQTDEQMGKRRQIDHKLEAFSRYQIFNGWCSVVVEPLSGGSANAPSLPIRQADLTLALVHFNLRSIQPCHDSFVQSCRQPLKCILPSPEIDDQRGLQAHFMSPFGMAVVGFQV